MRFQEFKTINGIRYTHLEDKKFEFITLGDNNKMNRYNTVKCINTKIEMFTEDGAICYVSKVDLRLAGSKIHNFL